MNKDNPKEEVEEENSSSGEISGVKSNLPYQAARFSLFAPLAAILINAVSIMAKLPESTAFIIALIAVIIYPVSLLMGIIALCCMKKYGKKRILPYAILGVLLNVGIISYSISLIPAMNRAREAARMLNRYQFNPPAGFLRNAQIAKSLPNVLDVYVKGNPNDTTSDIVLMLEDINGNIEKEEDMTPLLKDKPNIQLLKNRWKNYDINVFRIEEKVGNVATLTYNAQIPVIPAIQIKLMGLEARDHELKEILNQAINGVSGKSNWD